MLYFVYPEQMPTYFKIYPTPAGLTSWLESLVQKMTETPALPEKQGKSNLELLADGRDFCKNVKYQTHSYMTSIELKRTKSSMRLRSASDVMNLAEQLNLPFTAAQLQPPSEMWSRPSRRTS